MCCEQLRLLLHLEPTASPWTYECFILNLLLHLEVVTSHQSLLQLRLKLQVGMDHAGVPIRPGEFASFLCGCGWTGSNVELNRVLQWLVDQHISDQTSLVELQFEDLVETQQWPQKVTADACASAHDG